MSPRRGGFFFEKGLKQFSMRSIDYFETTNISFVASVALLQGDGVNITAHPHQNPRYTDHKAYRITPKTNVDALYQDFLQDKIKLSPRLIATKIIELRQMPIETNGGKTNAN